MRVSDNLWSLDAMRHFALCLRLVFFAGVVCVGLGALAADPVVSNVRVAQRAGAGLLDITYDLADADSKKVTVTVNISTNRGTSWFSPASSNLTGSTGECSVSPGLAKKIVWQGDLELPALLFQEVKVMITADDTPLPQFMVVDLSGGPNAASWPVTYLDNALPGGWTDEYKTTKLVLRKIPAGTFTMGSPDDELGRAIEYLETPHLVTLTRDFYIGVFEVTQRQWELVMGNRPSYYNNATYYATRPVEQVSYYDIRENPANSDDAYSDWPNNSAVNAGSFMGRLRAKTGLATLDLPTESQWEYACRAGTATALNSGKNLMELGSDANMAEVGRYMHNGGREGYPSCAPSGGTALAGHYLPNAWGLYDMHGNVEEWCLDYWSGTYPGTSADPNGAASGADRVLRGGGVGMDAADCRSAARSCYNPDRRDDGLRVARTLP